MKEKKTLLTEEGLLELKEELKELISVKRPMNLKAIKEARALGDLSENAEYDSAKNEQTELEMRIKKLEKIIENHEIIKNRVTGKVEPGSTVEVKYVDDDETDEYKIVGSQEADPFVGKISNESPIAMALLNKKVGDIVDVDSPNGSYKIQITEIK